uniref:Calcium-activated chloride channel regulator 1-like n=1 Tax=Ciona intestinalis TaxID=7719 RepID=H2XXP4_CIOIN
QNHLNEEIYFIIQEKLGSESNLVVKLQSNGYDGVLVAINPAVPENETLIRNIRDFFTRASHSLFILTKKRAYFRNINILVPKTWTGARYDTAIGLSYRKADVIVAPANSAKGNNPYTRQTGGCGDPGTYIHITPEYVYNPQEHLYGPREKAIVHEWSHLRWGVFDEYATGNHKRHYIDSNNILQATRQIAGEDQVMQYKNCLRRPINITNQFAQMPVEFEGNEYRIRSTIQYKNDPNEPINFHNSEADNEQNAKCNLKSLWEVIGASPDFREGANPPNPNLRNLTPTFRVVKPPQNRRFVVVLDVSGSMRGKRLLMMRQSTSEFISSLLSDGDKIGIVQFHSFAQTLLPIRHVNSQTDRFDICSRFPNRTGGSTCIGCGIQAAMQEMERDDPTEPCGHIVVLTDDEFNGCTIDAIFLTTTQNTALVQLVNRTSGRWFFAQDRDLRRLTGAFAVIADEDGDIRNLVSTVNLAYNNNNILMTNILQILYRQHNLSAEQNANGTVEIDKTVGLNTTFRFSYQIKPPCKFTLMCVSGTCEGHPLAQTDKSLKFIQFVIPGKATVGTWKYAINSKYKDTVSLSVTSRTLENVQPIVVRTSTRSTSTRIAGPIVIEATVTHGDPGPPLLYLSVVAVIEKPDYTEERLILLDNGAGADNTINDGVYSRTFIGFRERGRYSIQTWFAGTVTGNREAGESLSNESNERGVFTRVQTGTGIEFIGYNRIMLSDNCSNIVYIMPGNKNGTPLSDNNRPVTTAPSVRPDDLAPNRINDLTAVHVDPNDRNSGIRLSFTAPGDDADSGTGKNIIVMYLGNPNNLSTNFEENICPVTSIQPQIANTRETFTIPSPNITGMTGSIRIAIAIIASDEVPNNSSVSNIVILRFFIQPPIPSQ